MSNITGKFDWQTQEIVPAFVKGADAKAMYEATEGIRTVTMMGYDEATQTVYGSTPFLAARIDTLVRPLGMRVANLRDVSRPEIMRMVQGKHYTDTPALVLRTLNDSHSKNLSLVARIGEEVEKSGFVKQIPSGLVITGGGALTVGMVEAGRKIIGLPIRVGIPDKAVGLVDEIMDPQFATTIGLIFYGRKHIMGEQYIGKNFNRILKDFSLNSSFAKLKALFKQFIP